MGVVMLAIGFVAGLLTGLNHNSSTPNPPASALPSGGATASASASPSASPTPTPSATASALATPTAAGQPTPAPTLASTPPVQGTHVYGNTGKGNAKTPTITVTDNWALSWSFLCSGSGSFSVTVFDTVHNKNSSENLPLQAYGQSAQGVQQYPRGGAFQLQISTSCQWKIDVYEP